MRRLSYLGRVSSLRLLREVDLRRHIVFGVSLEVLVAVMKARDIGPDALRELPNVNIVVLKRLVVTLTCDGDSVFSAGKLICQSVELLVAFEIRILLLQTEEGSESYVQFGVGVDIAGVVAACGKNSGAGIGNVGQNS